MVVELHSNCDLKMMFILLLLPALTYAFLTKPILSPLRVSSVRSNSLMMAGKTYKVGIVGATGAVGEELLSVMEKRSFPCSVVKLFASEKSAGKSVDSPVYGKLTLEEFTFDAAAQMDVILLAVGGDFSLEWAEKLTAKGVLVIDNSSAFRMREDIPLVVPEINIDHAKKGNKKLIANPNCTTAIALMALWPIHKRFKIKKAIISTYQAASGAGAPGMQVLDRPPLLYFSSIPLMNCLHRN